jgi:hypothetical protein
MGFVGGGFMRGGSEAGGLCEGVCGRVVIRWGFWNFILPFGVARGGPISDWGGAGGFWRRFCDGRSDPSMASRGPISFPLAITSCVQVSVPQGC